MKTTPFFSVIVVAYNAEAHIEKTISSVLSQDFGDYEIVVKDAMSSDNTLQKIPADERIRVYSTKDGGIYDGMNEAIGYACGKYLMFLNCGDVFADSTVLGKIYQAAPENDLAIVYGDFTKKGTLFRQPRAINGLGLYRTTLCHQTVFFGKRVFETVGMHNTEYRIAADYDFLVRAYKSGVPYVHCDCVVCDYMGDGASETPKGEQTRKEEFSKIKATHFSKKERRRYDFKIIMSLPRLRKKINSKSSPSWLRRWYRKGVNLFNGRIK